MLDGAGKISVARTRPIDVFETFELGVFIDDLECQRAPKRGAVPEPREKRDGIGLAPLAAAAAVAALTADEFRIDQVLVDGQSGGKPVNEGDECGAVRFSGSPVAQHRSESEGGGRSGVGRNDKV
jgi:hypothetical protein